MPVGKCPKAEDVGDGLLVVIVGDDIRTGREGVIIQWGVVHRYVVQKRYDGDLFGHRGIGWSCASAADAVAGTCHVSLGRSGTWIEIFED